MFISTAGKGFLSAIHPGSRSKDADHSAVILVSSF